MSESFEKYLLKLRETPFGEQTEHTGRSALEALLNAFAGRAKGARIIVQHEPKRVAEKGAPDFKIARQGMILGYVETKGIGENLDKVLKSEQIKRYRSLSSNILLTDYLHFIWITKDGIRRETLCHQTDLEGRKIRLREESVAAVAKLLDGFFSTAPEGIGRSQALALALATRSRLLRDYLGEELIRQEREKKGERLYGLFQIFRDQVFHELTLAEFADAFAQMLAYGLFLARLNSASETVTLHNAREYVPGSFRLIRELVDFLAELEKPEYRDVRWVVEEVLSIVNGLKLEDIHRDLSFRNRKAINRKLRAADEEEHRLFERDPFIYFYEDYLRAYDKATSKGRGVYYTPPPIVNFIIRAVDDILKDSFGIRDGLADHKRVTVLDFACGTGTFLLEVFQRVFDNIGGADSGRADLIVRDHFLKNIYGFEYLIAPYTIAHLKLSQYLQDQKHPLGDEERLQVFLTNTLEPVEPQINYLLPAISDEVKAAQAVKEKPILVITGNPPYSGISKNMGAAAQKLVDRYKHADGRPLGERKHWLQDDYVKFIAFAQKKMDEVEEGVVGIITNHSWLDSPTFRGMRQSLMHSFEEIYILDLHGSARRKEKSDGSKDENVFDIEQGVAISIFVKRPTQSRTLRHADVWGSRLGKYLSLAESSLNKMHWANIIPASPSYLFRPIAALDGPYRDFPSVLEIFSKRSTGVQTSRDQLVVGFTERELRARIDRFADSNLPDEIFRTEFFREHRTGQHLRGDTRGWKLSEARQWARDNRRELQDSIREMAYRPFDVRYVIDHSRMIDWPRREIMQHIARGNVALLLPRQLASEGFTHSFCSNLPSEMCVISTKTKEQNYVFPLWLNPIAGALTENLSPDFRAFIDARYDHHYTPEEILGYIYAVLHAPAYRTRYAEFLRIDFPRVPFPESADDFEVLSVLGWALVEAHLLRELPRRGLAAYHGKGDHTVEKPRYSAEEQAVWINKTQCFKPVPRDVWGFHIGGYQVLDKYLKSRKGRVLTLDEIDHVASIADSLAFTIAQMARIDEAYRAALPGQAWSGGKPRGTRPAGV